MSASGLPVGDRCGTWMSRARSYCGRMPGHGGECRTPAALADRRAVLTERRRGQTLFTPEVRSRWNRTYKLKLMGLTPEQFARTLEAQGNACAMCRTPFKKASGSVSTMTTPAARPDCRAGAAASVCAACCASPAMSLSGTSRRTERWRGPTSDSTESVSSLMSRVDTEEVTGSIPVSPTNSGRSEAGSRNGDRLS
jgi:hypothetical protein